MTGSFRPARRVHSKGEDGWARLPLPLIRPEVGCQPPSSSRALSPGRMCFENTPSAALACDPWRISTLSQENGRTSS